MHRAIQVAFTIEMLNDTFSSFLHQVAKLHAWGDQKYNMHLQAVQEQK